MLLPPPNAAASPTALPSNAPAGAPAQQPPAVSPFPDDEDEEEERMLRAPAYRPRKLTAAERTVYHTANGRIVKGGGGIAPDVEVRPRPIDAA